jgi:hypothetical protein
MIPDHALRRRAERRSTAVLVALPVSWLPRLGGLSGAWLLSGLAYQEVFGRRTGEAARP